MVTGAGAGEFGFFGEVALMFDQPRTASVRCVTAVELFALHRDTFHRALEKFPDQMSRIAKTAETRFSGKKTT
jgi:CRP-like cAMP-binding protein